MAWPRLGAINPRNARYQEQKGEIQAFYQALGQHLESFLDPNEELSVPELVKRIVTHETVANTVIAAYEAHLENHLQASLEDQQKHDLIAIARELNPRTFRDLNRKRTAGNTEPKYWTGWFQGDGDGAGEYLKTLATDPDQEVDRLHHFSDTMRQWGLELKHRQGEILGGNGRMIYAGGDDFLGVLYRPNDQIQPTECWDFFRTFDSCIWRGLQKRRSATARKAHRRQRRLCVGGSQRAAAGCTAALPGSRAFSQAAGKRPHRLSHCVQRRQHPGMGLSLVGVRGWPHRHQPESAPARPRASLASFL